MVKEILGSMEFKVSWKAKMASLLMMTKLSSTYLLQTFGGTVELIRAESSITSMQRLATTGLTGHYRHVENFTSRTKQSNSIWIPKSLRFKPPGNHTIFNRIMERVVEIVRH